MNNNDFNEALKTWMEGAQAIINRYFEQHYPNNEKPILEMQEGKKYIRIVRRERASASAHCFIDRTNGDVLKADSWKVPAKHARGNIFDESNGLAKMEWTGTVYLRG